MKITSITRMELLAHMEKIELATQSRNLLEKKRKALMKEFMRIADKVFEHSDVLHQSATQANRALARAEATAGAEKVRSVALASRSELPLCLTSTSIMGVKVPRIELLRVPRPILSREFSFVGDSTTIDEAASAFMDEVDAIIHLAESELCLTLLASEIQLTSRRLNALDHLLIPQLRNELKFIQIALDERERSDHFRLKLVKRFIERKKLAGKKQ